MKLTQLQEARYAGEHPIVKSIRSSIARGEHDFFMNIKDKNEAEAAVRGIIAAFGQPDMQSPATEDEFRNMLWNINIDTILQIVDGMPVQKKLVGQRPDEPRQTMMNIALL